MRRRFEDYVSFDAIPSYSHLIPSFVYCSSWPHGKTSVFAMILSIVSYICHILASNLCSYVQVNGVLFDFPPYGLSSSGRGGAKYGVGLFSYEDQFESEYTCTAYSSNMIDNASYFDAAFKTARAFAIMANVFVGVGMICLCISACVEFTPTAMKLLGFLFGAGSLFELLTFSFFASSVCDDFGSCHFYVGASFSIISTTLSFITALVTLKIPPAKETTFEGVPAPILALPEAGTKTVTETYTPDGTKKITETMVNADGTQTVTETVVLPEPEKV
jgi:hypothetical protein